MTHTLIEWGRKAISSILPEGRFKDFLRSLLFRYYNPLDALSKIITQVEELEDGSLRVELNDGVKFYAQPDGEKQDSILDFSTRIRSRYGNQHILTKIVTIEYFGTLWRQLVQQYRDEIYQKYYKVKKGDIVVDVGAHIGTFTVRAAKTVGDGGMVVAIEPEMDNLRVLERNIRANGLNNVVIVPKGVWSRKDRLKLFIKENTSGHSFVRCRGRFMEVEVDTLDNILRELGVNKVDFIKMIVEGAEIEAYKGMKETLKDNDVKLAIATYHKAGEKETYRTIVSWLNRDGFEARRNKGIVYGLKKPLL